MTYQEVLKHFNSLQKRYTTEHNGVMCEKVKVAVRAIEKQIPKKPKETDAYPHRLYCPYCTWALCYNKENADSFRMMHMFRYCPECGQSIDWSDE